jgi:hypothetical protein
MISFDLIAHEKSLATRDYSNLKTNLALSLTEFSYDYWAFFCMALTVLKFLYSHLLKY